MSAHYIVTDIYSNGWYLCLCIEDNEYLCGVANIHEYFHSHLYFSSNGPRHMIVMAILNERTRTWPVLWLKIRNLKIQKLFFNKFYFLVLLMIGTARCCKIRIVSYQSYMFNNQLRLRSRHKGTFTVVGFPAWEIAKLKLNLCRSPLLFTVYPKFEFEWCLD